VYVSRILRLPHFPHVRVPFGTADALGGCILWRCRERWLLAFHQSIQTNAMREHHYM
jgi:hypothetical protein